MKFLEEVVNGESFLFNETMFILTSDFKIKNKETQRLGINLKDGNPRWIGSNEMVDSIQIYTLDKENNILAIREISKTSEDNI